MARTLISASKLIAAPAEQVYAIIADYSDGHQRILPRPPFVSMEVEQGGVGAGTVIRFQMRLMRRLQTFRAAISEPEPGRVLVETDLEKDSVTTFTVEPQDDGGQAYVTITTQTPVRGGVVGSVQGWLAARLLRPVYVEELEKLAALAAQPHV